MTQATINGIPLAYKDHGGPGPCVVLVMGTGSPGRVWDLHQVPALRAAGFRVVTFNNRGIPPSAECPGGFTMDDMVGDLVGLIEHLACGPVHLIGTSLGARIVTETALARPDLVKRAVALAAHARFDPVRQAMTRGEIALADDPRPLPDDYRAAVSALHYLSPATLRDPRRAQDWLDMLTFGDGRITAGHRAQLQVSEGLQDRRQAYGAITVPLLAVGFADDAAIPPYLAQEVAEVIPHAQYAEIPDAGHYGYLEQPGPVNRLIVDYLNQAEAAPLAQALGA
jgi:pimeloyl-ACP methyl ester carboxylesterase